MRQARHEIRTYSADAVLVAERRKHIVQHALRLFARQGYDRTTMDEVLRSCGMSKGALYHYVGSKEDILALAIDEACLRQGVALDALSERVAYVSAAEALTDAIKTYLDLIDTLYDTHKVLERETLSIPRYYRLKAMNNSIRVRQFFEGILQKGVDSGELSVPNVSFMAYLLCSACLAWTARKWLLGRRYSLVDYRQELTEGVLKMMEPVSKN
jgi:AcrR family transcriptional regulator